MCLTQLGLRREVGLIVAGVGVSSGALSNDIYTAVIIMVAVTTIITPIWLKLSYKNEPLEPAAAPASSTKADPIH